MSIKGSTTTSSYLDFDSTLNKSLKMLKEKDGKQHKVAFLAICGVHFGLRVTDLLSLRHSDLMGDSISLIEKKTGKKRVIRINETVKEAYGVYDSKLKTHSDEDFLFMSQKNNPFSIKQVNRLLKATFGKKNLNVSSHSLRKTFGRRVWENDGCSERSLIMLSQLFNHSSTAITRIYLGIQQEEFDDIYMNL